MRIAYLTQSYPPMISGAAIAAQQIAEAMAQRGHNVLVIAASDRENAYHTYKKNITILRLRSFNNPLRVGQRLIAYPLFDVIKALKRFKPDIIHAHEPLLMGYLALNYAKHARIPTSLTIHQLPWFVASYLPTQLKPIVEKPLWIYARILLKRYTSLIVPTQTIAKIVEEQTELRPHVISYGLDLQAFHPTISHDCRAAVRKKLNLSSEIPLLLHVGRLDTDKRVDKVIRAAVPAVRKTEAHFLIVGDGSQKNRLIRLCRELGIEKRVHFSGFIHPAKLPEIYQSASLFVTASEIETQGIVLLEASACGLPIVAFDVTCISEIVHDNKNGFLIKPGNIDAFSQAIIELLRAPSRSRFMGRQGHLIAKKHDVQITFSLHANLYQRMIKQTRLEYEKHKNVLLNW
ncbi:MAG: glycosyltransferase [Anaerolineales bacterium]|nr:glycosyltransferase [Anaerolineales bacterium]